MKKLLLVLFSLAPGFAQVVFDPAQIFPRELNDYLGLSSAQTESMLRLKMDYSRIVSEKYRRAAQVQSEIAEWTNKDPIDPIQLGLRYAELENIQRELREALATTRQKTVAVLDNAQKTKLKLLEDAMKLQSVIGQAQCENLLAPSRPQVVAFTGNFVFYPIGQVQAGFGCGPAIIRNPFTPQP